MPNPPSPDKEREAASPQRGFSWFPGHMRKALRQLESQLELADVVLLVLDARLPRSSRQPELEELLARKRKELIFVLNKSDLAQAEETERWLAWFKKAQLRAVSMRSSSGRGAGPLEQSLAQVRQQLNTKRQAKGMRPRDPRLVVAGIPNVGKSSLLNRLAGATRAKTGAKPGVTRGNQWVSVEGKWQILDSPGILYPKIEDAQTLMALAAASCVRHEAIPQELAGQLLLETLWERQLRPPFIPLSLWEEWQGENSPLTPEERLAQLAWAKKLTIANKEPDIPRCAHHLLQAFAQGEMAPLTLELTP